MRSAAQTFHSIACLDVHVDAMDVAGENQLDIDHDMIKQRISPDGKKTIGDPFTEVVSATDSSIIICQLKTGVEEKRIRYCSSQPFHTRNRGFTS